jgi:indolepyruvate decarboxylase
MAFPMDVSDQPVLGEGTPHAPPKSDPKALENAVNAIVDAVTRAKTACVLPGYLVARAGLRREATALIDASGLPFAAMFMDKATLDEAHPNYIGMYDGRLMEEEVRAFVEGADCVLGLGALWSDFNTGAFTAKLDRSKTINVFHHSTRVGNAFFEDVEMKDVLTALAKRLPKRTDLKGPKPADLGAPKGAGGDKITAEALYPRWHRFLKPDDNSRRRDRHEFDGARPRENAQGRDVPQSDALGRDRLGHARRLRRRGCGARSSHGADHRRRLPPAHRAGSGPVSSPRPEADYLPSQQ